MTPEETKEKGVSRLTLWRLKKRINQGRKINWKTPAIKRMIS